MLFTYTSAFGIKSALDLHQSFASVQHQLNKSTAQVDPDIQVNSAFEPIRQYLDQHLDQAQHQHRYNGLLLAGGLSNIMLSQAMQKSSLIGACMLCIHSCGVLKNAGAQLLQTRAQLQQAQLQIRPGQGAIANPARISSQLRQLASIGERLHLNKQAHLLLITLGACLNQLIGTGILQIISQQGCSAHQAAAVGSVALLTGALGGALSRQDLHEGADNSALKQFQARKKRLPKHVDCIAQLAQASHLTMLAANYRKHLFFHRAQNRVKDQFSHGLKSVTLAAIQTATLNALPKATKRIEQGIAISTSAQSALLGKEVEMLRITALSHLFDNAAMLENDTEHSAASFVRVLESFGVLRDRIALMHMNTTPARQHYDLHTRLNALLEIVGYSPKREQILACFAQGAALDASIPLTIEQLKRDLGRADVSPTTKQAGIEQLYAAIDQYLIFEAPKEAQADIQCWTELKHCYENPTSSIGGSPAISL